jgi:hypothetical protein
MKIRAHQKLRIIFGQGSGAVVLNGITYRQALEMLQGVPMLAFIDVAHDLNADPVAIGLATVRHGINVQVDIL